MITRLLTSCNPVSKSKNACIFGCLKHACLKRIRSLKLCLAITSYFQLPKYSYLGTKHTAISVIVSFFWGVFVVSKSASRLVRHISFQITYLYIFQACHFPFWSTTCSFFFSPLEPNSNVSPSFWRSTNDWDVIGINVSATVRGWIMKKSTQLLTERSFHFVKTVLYIRRKKYFVICRIMKIIQPFSSFFFFFSFLSWFSFFARMLPFIALYTESILSPRDFRVSHFTYTEVQKLFLYALCQTILKSNRVLTHVHRMNEKKYREVECAKFIRDWKPRGSKLSGEVALTPLE